MLTRDSSTTMAAHRPLRALARSELLPLCATADADFQSRLTSALEAELSRPGTPHALTLLDGLCEMAPRTLAAADGGGLPFQQKLVELLHSALERNVVPAEGGQTAERVLAVVEGLAHTKVAGKQLSKLGLRRICRYLLGQRGETSARIVRLLSRGTLLHEAFAHT